MTDANYILEATNLSKTYGRGDNKFDALKGVSLNIQRGESVAIVGKSGSGKSTLMHMLALLDTPSTGTLRLNGEDTKRIPQSAVNKIRNRTFGFVFQQFFLTPKTSVLDNVILPLKIAGVGGRERRDRGMDALEALGIADKAKNDAGALSGGQKQRVVIARALVNNPDVIFADEPTGNLDTTTGSSVEAMLFELQRQRQITLVIVTHDAELAERCDRRVVVRDGVVLNHDHQEVASA